MAAPNSFRDELLGRWTSAGPVSELPAPWRHVPTSSVGGIHSAGLDQDGRYLLLISHSGRGLLDCNTGEKIARDYDEDEGRWLDRQKLVAQGIGPLEGAEIAIAGRFIGGGLAASTRDGWYVNKTTLAWPRTYVWAEAPGEARGFTGGGTFYRLWDWDEPFAWGFSQSGRTLLCACSNAVALWTRPVTG